MYIGFYNFHNPYNKNRMLNSPASLIGDDLMYPFFLLAQNLKKAGHQAVTIDTDDLGAFDAVVFVEFPGFGNKYFSTLIKKNFNNMYLVALESPIIKPDNYESKNHGYFKKVFTWEDQRVDNKKYFKINYSHDIPKTINISLKKKEKCCAMIASNKSTNRPKELYSQRIEAIRWFEKNHPKDFDLYGGGWDKYNFQGEFLGVKLARLNRLKLLTKLLAPHYPSYKGTVESKKQTYQKYKFSICYENAEGFLGYITEKIFDCFLAGCVPVYLGASNIADHIPKETFINKRDFATYGQLYNYLKNMKDDEYVTYLEAIKSFLQSDRAYPFSAQCFSETITKEIL